MVDMESHLKELCARIVPNLDNCTNQDKKDAYTYLDLKVKATPEGADIKGFLDPSLLTTARTWLTFSPKTKQARMLVNLVNLV